MASGSHGPPVPRLREAPRTRDGFYEVRPGDVVGRDDLTIVDVRAIEDLLGDFGHIHRVVHVPADAVRELGLSGLSKRKPIVLVCANGRESRECARALVERHDFREVYHLVGGMVRWLAEARPVARSPTWRTPEAQS